MNEDSARPEDDVEMGFLEHLGELRTRLIRALLGLVPAIGACWIWKERLLEWFVQPMVIAFHKRGLGQPSIHFANPIDPFVAYLKLAMIAGLIVASPWLFYQIWAFIAPGLYQREKKLALPFVIASTVFFLGGVYFGYEVVFPLGFETFFGFAGMLPSETLRIEPTIMIGEYLSFATRMLLAFGLVFEVPVIITFLAAAGIVDWKQLLKFSRWWIVIATLLASVLTPPDVGSQLLMLIPLVVLYFISVGLAFLFGHQRKKNEGDAAPT